jgi:hypothetical protein
MDYRTKCSHYCQLYYINEDGDDRSDNYRTIFMFFSHYQNMLTQAFH